MSNDPIMSLVVGIIGGLFGGGAIGPAVTSCLTARREWRAGIAARQRDLMAYSKQWLTEISTIPFTKSDGPCRPDVAYGKGLPQFQNLAAKARRDFGDLEGFKKVVDACIFNEEDAKKTPVEFVAIAKARVQSVIDFIDRHAAK